MRGILKLMSLRLINEKNPLFDLCLSSLSGFVPWWLNSYTKKTVAKCKQESQVQYWHQAIVMA
jgi:hypothetical protein